MNRDETLDLWERLIVNMTHDKYVNAFLRKKPGHDRLRASLRLRREIPSLFTRSREAGVITASMLRGPA